MSISRICECCGQKIVTYSHGLNQRLVDGLWKLYRKDEPTRLDELNLTNSEFANFQKLQYFGLVERTGNAKWAITRTGIDFIKGNIQIPKSVKTEVKRVIERNTDKVFVHEVSGCMQYKRDWQEQAS